MTTVQPPAEEAQRFLRHLFGDREANIYAPTKGRRPEIWQQVFMVYTPHAVPSVGDQRKDSYISPALWKVDQISRETFKGTEWVWCEYDGANGPISTDPGDWPYDLPFPSLIVRTSQNNAHLYWRLKWFETDPEMIERINRGILKVIDADASGWDYQQVLRIPGFTNWKPERGEFRVTLAYESADSYGIEEFPLTAEPAPSTGGSRHNSAELDALFNEAFRLDPASIVAGWPKNARTLFDKGMPHTGTGERNKALFTLARCGFEANASHTEILAVLWDADSRWKKFLGRPDRKSQLYGIYQKAQATHEESESTVHIDEDKPSIKVRDEVRVVWYSNVLAEAIEWYEKPWLPVVGLAGLAGPEDTGKSTVFVHEIAKLTTGAYGRPPIRVLYLTNEDDISIVKARLQAAEADISRVGFVTIRTATESGEPYDRELNLKHDLDKLRDAIGHDPEIRALYLDPANSFMGIDEDKDGYSTIRGMLELLSKFARDEKVLVRPMKHTKKDQREKLPIVSQIYGSKAWTEVVRNFAILWPTNSETTRQQLGLDEDDPTNVIMLRGKNNYAPKSQPAKAFQIKAMDVEVDGISFPGITYMEYHGERDITNDDVQERTSETRQETEKRIKLENKTDQWLVDLLNRNDGRLPRKAIVEQYVATDLGSDRTLKNRAKSLGIESEQIAGGQRNEVEWVLPQHLRQEAPPSPQGVETNASGNGQLSFHPGLRRLPM